MCIVSISLQSIRSDCVENEFCLLALVKSLQLFHFCNIRSFRKKLLFYPHVIFSFSVLLSWSPVYFLRCYKINEENEGVKKKIVTKFTSLYNFWYHDHSRIQKGYNLLSHAKMAIFLFVHCMYNAIISYFKLVRKLIVIFSLANCM